MDTIINYLLGLGLPALVALGAVVVLYASGAIVFIPNNKFGVIERKWSYSGKKSESFMSLNGSPGFLPNTLVGGWHFFMPYQYRVHKQDLITISEIGYLFARTGKNLPAGQALASWPEGVEIEDAEGFLTSGGQRGPQRRILRGGAYAINTALFAVITDEAIVMVGSGDDSAEIEHISKKIANSKGFDPVVVGEDNIAVVTVQDGPSLEHGDVIAPTVGEGSRPGDKTFHNGFQDIEAFLNAGGRRGNQEQVLTEGTYYINRLFATIEMAKKTIVPIGFVGVVNSFTGHIVDDSNHDDTAVASVVPVGSRGIWDKPLRPGKYAYNPFAYNIAMVPTTNFQLRWVKSEGESKDYDANLSEIKLITRDAFEPILPLTLVVKISPADAPKVIQQFSDVTKLVNETLDPMVSAWFKDSAQAQTLLEVVTRRAELQKNALLEMSDRFSRYHLSVREVMIGTPKPDDGDEKISLVFDQLRKRQIAVESATTYEQEKQAAEKLKGLNEAKAIAEQQAALTASSISIEVAKNKADGEYEAKKREANGIVAMANARATEIETIGKAEASSLKAQAEALGGEEAILKKTLMEEIMRGLKESQQPVVPSIVLGENGKDSLSSLLFGLMAQNGTFTSLTQKPEEK